MAVIHPPIYISWSAGQLDLSDPFQRRWYIQQVLTHGRAEDVRALDLDDITDLFDQLTLPPDVHSLWQRFLEARHAKGQGYPHRCSKGYRI